MGKMIPIKFEPGSLFSDIVEDKLGTFRYQEITNFRILKKGEWQNVIGYVNYMTGFTSIKAAVEVTEDNSGDRFLLIQDGTSLKRVDYDSGDGNGYENETPSTLSLPSGVTIGASATLRFFYHNGIVRISGASEPLWYGYKTAKTFFNGDDEFAFSAQWVLDKAAVLWASGTNDAEIISIANIFTGTSGSVSEIIAGYFKFFYVFDDGQYELLKTGDVTTNIFGVNDFRLATKLRIRINGSSLKDNPFNKRITGLGVAFATKIPSQGEAFEDATEIFYVNQILPINEALGTITYLWQDATFDSGSPTQLQISNPSNDIFLSSKDGYLDTSVKVNLSFSGDIDTTVASITYGDGTSSRATITFADDISGIFSGSNDYNVTVVITRDWQYNSGTGYWTTIGIDLQALGTAFGDFAGYNQFSTGTYPNWKDFFVIEGLAYVGSQEAGEKDSLRYSPANQYDVFPAGNIISSEVGDTDEIVRALKRSDRFVILKNRSISQGAFSGGTYYEHIGLAQEGLYCENGVLVIDDVLWFMDKEDVYVFDGNSTPRRFFENSLLQEFYKENVTTSSFMIYNKEDGEVWFVIGTKILVYSFKFKNFYLRETDITPLLSFLNQENQGIVAASTKLVNYNHSESTYNETINGQIVTSQVSMNERWHKKLKHVETYLTAGASKGAEDMQIQMTDYQVFSKTLDHPDASNLENYVTGPFNRFFKNLTLTLQFTTSYNSFSVTIRHIKAIIESWKNF